ncbi:hypothetical protein BSKO_06599 [Bryopsis sp. KO-2023]|nr:hypothetical protein BSKO_06599 [Bryopsis sp. KO-2023]
MRGAKNTVGKGSPHASAPTLYLCPLSGQLMQNPVVLVESGQTYEQSAIVKYLERGNRCCPISKTPLLNCAMVSNIVLKNCIDGWVSRNGGGVQGGAGMKAEESEEYDWATAMLEEQFQGMYKGWDSNEVKCGIDDGSEPMDNPKSMEKIVRLLYSPEATTQQAAAVSLAKFCWGSDTAQSHVGSLKKGGESALHRLAVLLQAEVEDGRPGYSAWALAELCRGHKKNQMRLAKVQDVNVVSLLLQIFELGSDQWVARGARLIGGWCNGNSTIQTMMLNANIVQALVNCLRENAPNRNMHAGLALMHVCYLNNTTGMQAMKGGALIYVPQLLSSNALPVRAIAAGIVEHLLSHFDYNWGANSEVLELLVDLLHQVEEYASVLAATAIFELLNKEKADMKYLMEMDVIPRVIDLLHTCSYPGYRRRCHKFLINWAKHVSSQGRGSSSEVTGLVMQKFTDLIPVNSSSSNEVAVHVVFMVLPFGDNYKYLLGSLGEFERLAMDATISAEGRAMCQNIVSYVRKVEIERRGRVQVLFTTAAVVVGLRLVKFLGKAVRQGWFNWV